MRSRWGCATANANGRKRSRSSSPKINRRLPRSCASTAFLCSTNAVKRSNRPAGGRRLTRARSAVPSLCDALLLLAWAGAFVPIAGAAVEEPLQRATFNALRGSVVRVEADRERGGVSLGTGVTVAPAVVVTNCHVIRDAATIRISGGGSLWEI